jgi:hypothetical protein
MLDGSWRACQEAFRIPHMRADASAWMCRWGYSCWKVSSQKVPQTSLTGQRTVRQRVMGTSQPPHSPSWPPLALWQSGRQQHLLLLQQAPDLCVSNRSFFCPFELSHEHVLVRKFFKEKAQCFHAVSMAHPNAEKTVIVCRCI